MFRLNSAYTPTGDQPTAIDALCTGLDSGVPFQTLLGVTGSGKTFTMANIIQNLQRPALIMAHNKTLAAQLAQEFKEFFPDNAVHYFVSYYDYYQPEAYVVKSGAYIEKVSTINEEIDRLRHAATESLLTRKDVIIVASVSCIYGIGAVDEYEKQAMRFTAGKEYVLEAVITLLVSLQFKRVVSDEFHGGMFRLMGDTLEIWPSSSEEIVVLEFFGDELERISRKIPLTYEVVEDIDEVVIFPAKHFVTSSSIIEEVVPQIRTEMDTQVAHFLSLGKNMEAERIKMRTEYDIEMLTEVGYVNGVENYSMYLAGRQMGDPPATLMDFFPQDFITFVDESHITIPQIGGMYAGDRARKENLVNYGFRLPSALENRPLRFHEFEKKIGQTVFVSATPSTYEYTQSGDHVARQVIRPTGLLDPIIEIEDMEYMVDSIMGHIADACTRGERSIITTLTKKSSEDLATYLSENGIKTRYLHSEIETIERLEILRDYRLGEIDVIVGVNLLREGLDLPETSFIAILDAEKIGFLRSKTALLQIIGRAARNVNGKVVMYVHKELTNNIQGRMKNKEYMLQGVHITDEVGTAGLPPPEMEREGLESDPVCTANDEVHTDGDILSGMPLSTNHQSPITSIYSRYPGMRISTAMADAIYETETRRQIQHEYNVLHGITPRTIISSIKEVSIPRKKTEAFAGGEMSRENVGVYIKRLELEMDVASANLDFEKAAQIRDELIQVRKKK